MSKRRAEELIRIIGTLEQAIADLDDLQAGDIKGQISPIKHRIRDALAPEAEKLRAIAREEWGAPEPGSSLRDVSWLHGWAVGDGTTDAQGIDYQAVTLQPCTRCGDLWQEGKLHPVSGMCPDCVAENAGPEPGVAGDV